MPDVSADTASRTGRPLLWVAGFVLFALVGALVLTLRGDREVITPAAPRSASPSSEQVSRSGAASALLGELTRALTDGTRREAVALAAPGVGGARQALGWIYDNDRELGITDLSMRFVDEDADFLPRSEVARFGRDAWVGDVAVTWRIGGFDAGVSDMELPMAFVDTADGVAFAGVAATADDPAPLWLVTDLAVRRSGRALVAVADPGRLDAYTRLADQAVRDVRSVLSAWRGRLVVEVPADQTQLDVVLDAPPHTYDSIAAVTATVDGSSDPSSPVHILVNPGVFGKLGREGSQIVMSHEATHVAVDAATSDMPLWLLEGFADYVALSRADLPVSVTASQILAEVRRNGPPRALPGEKEFDPANSLLGTSYESAWLACDLLAQEYGERRLIDFYESVDDGTPVEEAFADLGTTEARFTARWRDRLRELAG